jgi:cytochrome P450
MTYDEEIYPDAHTFKPERWLTEDGKKLRKLASEENFPTFGFG